MTNINVTETGEKQDTEVCAVKLNIPTTNNCIISIYRSSTGNFIYFLKGLETILNVLYTTNIVYYLWRYKWSFDNFKKRQPLYTVLATYNLTSNIPFPTRIQNGSVSATDNILIDIIKNGNYTICPLINGLSHHNAQIILK